MLFVENFPNGCVENYANGKYNNVIMMNYQLKTRQAVKYVHLPVHCNE